jgi:signal transduction histidine kinase
MNTRLRQGGLRMKVLIVDDIPANLRLLRAVLEGENIEVVEAPDGLQALAVLEREAVDAIISDILMPRMDGYRLCQEVRRSRRWQEMPFIFYTASYTSPRDEKLCYDLGADKYLRKPAPAQALLAALSEATHPSAKRPPHRTSSSSDTEVMREYSERLVSKLEQRNQQLEKARAELQEANLALESRVQQRTAELNVANQELESFSYSVSHDLRAPLRHIGGFIDILLRNGAGQLDDTNLKHLQVVKASAQKMSDLIDVLLELSKVTRAEIRRRPVDLSAMAVEVLAELQHNDPSRVVKPEITPGLNAHGDQRLLRIVLVNLLGNAWKYSRKRAEARIEFSKIACEGSDTFVVRDNGAGFDMAYAGKLFGAFQRLHADADFEGIGIGLATVQRIIHRHNGKIRAEGIAHQGAAFYFTLGDSDPKHAQTAA